MRGIEGIENYLEVSNRVGTGGQPEADQFADIAAAGYQVVVNLALPNSREAVANEDWLVTEHGMTYVHLPVSWERPTQADVARFFALMDAFRDQRVFVHCIKNMRVAVFVYLYRVCREGVAQETAEATMLRIWRPHGTWRRLLAATLAEASSPSAPVGADAEA
jgi:protein tyrosine phosphatase (PTP) superfamily phosphohydrolase (DUF442 family)